MFHGDTYYNSLGAYSVWYLFVTFSQKKQIKSKTLGKQKAGEEEPTGASSMS